MLKGMKISDLEQAKKKIEIWFPRHIDQVRKELGEERAEEYVKRGESLLNGLLGTTFASIVLFSVSIPEAISFLRDLEMQLLVLFFAICPIVDIVKTARMAKDFYDLPDAVGVWRKAGIVTMCLYFLSAGFYFYQVAEDSGWFEDEALEEVAETIAYEWSEQVDIPVAGISLKVPESCQGIAWKQRDRNKSEFTMAFADFQASVQVQTVYTSENASLKEFEEEFCYVMNGKLGKRPSVKPGIHVINGRGYLAATGLERATSENVLVSYMTIHKGASFRLNVTMPAGSHVPKSLSLIEDIVKSVTFYDPE